MAGFEAFLQAIPSAATSPLALTAYLAALAGSLILGFRVKRNKNLLHHLKDVPAKDRRSLLQAEMNIVIPDNITAEQWLRSRRNTFYFLGFLFFLSCITLVAVLALINRSSGNDHMSANGKGPVFAPPMLNGRTLDACIVSSNFPVARDWQCIQSAQHIIATAFCNEAGYSGLDSFTVVLDKEFQASWKLHRDLGPNDKLVQQWLEDDGGGYIFSKIVCN